MSELAALARRQFLDEGNPKHQQTGETP